MPTSTLTSKGQITVPKEVRDRLRLRGDERESCYGASRADIRAVLQRLLASEGLFVFEDAEAFRRALGACRRGKADFSNLLIGARSASRGARTTYTFDRKLARHESFSLLG